MNTAQIVKLAASVAGKVRMDDPKARLAAIAVLRRGLRAGGKARIAALALARCLRTGEGAQRSAYLPSRRPASPLGRRLAAIRRRYGVRVRA